MKVPAKILKVKVLKSLWQRNLRMILQIPIAHPMMRLKKKPRSKSNLRCLTKLLLPEDLRVMKNSQKGEQHLLHPVTEGRINLLHRVTGRTNLHARLELHLLQPATGEKELRQGVKELLHPPPTLEGKVRRMSEELLLHPVTEGRILLKVDEMSRPQLL